MSLCDVQVCPDFLPEMAEFTKEYIKPIETGRKPEAGRKDRKKMLRKALLLQELLRPIVHRVSPETLARNLPPKLEVLLALSMPRALQHLYSLAVEMVCCLLFWHR